MTGYEAPTRDMRFVMHDLELLPAVRKLPGFEEASADLVDAVLEEGGKLAGEALAPLNATGDAQGAILENGVVRAADGFAEAQPVFLTSDPAERPNRPQVLVLVDGVEDASLDGIDRVLDMFDGGDNEAVAAARERWSAFSFSGHDLTYWQQTANGDWEERD